MADMAEGAKSFPIFHDLTGFKLLSAKTVRATARALVCRVQLSVGYRGNGQFVSGTFTVHIFPNGTWRANFD